MYNMLKISLVLVLTFVSCLSQFCSNITMGYYTYDLSHLSTVSTIDGYEFDLCNVRTCVEPSGYSYNTFITQKSTTGQCIALTPSTQLSKQNIKQITSGLQFTYPQITKYIINNSTPQTITQTTTTNQTIINIICNIETNSVQNVSVDTQTNIFTFNVQSKAGCSFEGNTQIWEYFTNKAIIFALVFWIVGLYSMFLGYFLIRVTIMIYGFITAAGFSLIFFTFGYPEQPQPIGILNWMLILSCIFGLFYGFFLITLPRFGYFNIGIWFGVIISLLLQNSVFIYTKSLIPFYVCLGVISFVCGVAGIMGFKYFIIVSTSFISGFLLVRPLGFYLPYYPNEFNFYKERSTMPWQYYLFLIAIIILSIIGIIFQSWLFKKRGRKDNLFHLQDNTDIKTKFKNLLQFKEVKDFFKKGTEEFKMLKNLVASPTKKTNEDDDYSRHSQVEQYPAQKQTKGKYRPPSLSDDISNNSQSQRSSEQSIEMVEVKKKNQQQPQRILKKNK